MAMAPQMHFDVLLSVAEKLLFSPDNDFRLDLRDPNADVVNFMFAGPACRWAFFTQFRRLSKLSVNSEIHLSCPSPIQGIRGTLANNKEFFQGPCVVSDKLFYVLLCQGVLQLKIVDSFFKFGKLGLKGTNSENTSPTSTDDESQLTRQGKVHYDVANESPAESLVRLFFKDSLDKLSNISPDDLGDCDLKLDFVKIQDDTTIFEHLNRILNLNAERLLLEIASEFNNCVTKFVRSRISAKRTKTVTISYTIDINDSECAAQMEFPFTEFLALLRYVADACPNLETLMVHFLFQGEFCDDDFKVLSNWIKSTIKGFAQGGLPTLHLACDLTISFRAFFPEATLMEANKTNHELAKMGEQRLLPLRTSADGGIENNGIDMDLPDTYTITRRIQVQEKPVICIVYSLVGIEEDSTNNDWDGFHGPAANLEIIPAAVPAFGNHFQQDHNNDDFSD